MSTYVSRCALLPLPRRQPRSPTHLTSSLTNSLPCRRDRKHLLRRTVTQSPCQPDLRRPGIRRRSLRLRVLMILRHQYQHLLVTGPSHPYRQQRGLTTPIK
jgi:hypothetical protein